MFRIDKNMTVYLTRGDACLLPIGCKDSEGEPYIFRQGETLRLRIFKKRQYGEVVLSKDTVVTTDTERAQIFLSSEETRLGEVINAPVEYWYEIELNSGTSVAQTIVGYDKGGPKVFRLYPECDTGDDVAEGDISLMTSAPLTGYILDPDVIYGRSAYEIAVLHGFDGNEIEWLDSLRRQIRGDAEEVIRVADTAYKALENYSRLAVERIEEMSETVLDVVQTDGSSETAVMSQRAVTEMIGNCAGAIKGNEIGSAVRADGVSPLGGRVRIGVSGIAPDGSVRIFTCGKNLAAVNNVTVPHSDTVLFRGDITGSFCLSYKNRLSGNINPNVGIITCIVDGVERWTTGGTTLPFTFSGRLTDVILYNWNGATEGGIEDIQLELGSVQTDYEPYNEGECIELTDREWAEVGAIFPSMTVYSDTDTAILTLDYNKDINKVIERLVNAIISLGGNI